MGLLDGVKARVSSAAQSVTRTAEAAVDKVQDTANKVTTTAQQAATTVAEKGAQVVDTAKKTVVTAQTKADASIQQAKNVGAQVMQSVVSGKASALSHVGGAGAAAGTPSAAPAAGAATTAAPAAAGEKVDINAGGAEARKRLLAGAPQNNPISDKAGNSGQICGGASTVAALVMTEKDGKNAAALEKTIQQSGVKMSPDEEKALAAFKSGTMTPTDVQHLQQVTYRAGCAKQQQTPGATLTPGYLEESARKKNLPLTQAETDALAAQRAGRATPQEKLVLKGLAERTDAWPKDANGVRKQDEPKATELNAGGMAALNASLAKNGAYNGQPVTFHNTRMKDDSNKDFNHWTVTAGGAHVNTMGNPARASNARQPEVATDPADQNWRSEVRYDGSTITADYKDPGSRDSSFRRLQKDPANMEDEVKEKILQGNPPDPKDATEERAAARAALDKSLGKGVTDSSADDAALEVVRKNPEYLRYATPEERGRLMARLETGWVTAEEKEAAQKILAGSGTEVDRAAAQAAYEKEKAGHWSI